MSQVPAGRVCDKPATQEGGLQDALCRRVKGLTYTRERNDILQYDRIASMDTQFTNDFQNIPSKTDFDSLSALSNL